MKTKKLALWMLIVFAVISMVMLILQRFIIINTTASQPYGIYLKTDKAINKGDLVSVCVSPAYSAEARKRGYIKTGSCPGGYSPIIKEVVAVTGDIVEIKENGVFINGQFIPNSKPLEFDGIKRPMPNLVGETYILHENEFFCLSSYNQYSFDGRYLGITLKKDVQTVIKPFITW